MTMKTGLKRLLSASVAAVAIGGSLAACGSSSSGSGGSGDGANGTLTRWTHNAGNKAELAADQSIVDAFNASQSKVKIKVQAFPQEPYNSSVVSAAAAHKLPCLVDI